MRRLTLLGCALASSALTACSGTPTQLPRPPEVDRTPPSSALPLPLPARWVDSGGSTLVGPAVPGGTLVLLGGRRAVLHADGTMEVEKPSSSRPPTEPLNEIIEVPMGAGRVLVARTEHTVLRLEDPLGPMTLLARSDEGLRGLGAAPGLVAIWSLHASLPRFLDAERGDERPAPSLPVLPLRSIAFLDAKRGAAVFEASGLAVTQDGGATWRPAIDTDPGDALRSRGVRVRSGELRAFAWEDGPEGVIDVASARTGRFKVEEIGPTALARWIRTTGRDPLEAVASAGFDLPDGDALVASHGLVARIDPRTGAVLGLLDLADGKGTGPCGSGRAGQSVWVACALEDRRAEMFDPFGVVRLSLEDPLRKRPPEMVRNGEAELRVSPSGGVMLLAACNNNEAGAACVRQPDGKWKTVRFDSDLGERGVAPLADGRIAFLRGMFDGDDAPASVPADAEGAPKRLHVAELGVDGKERALAPIPFAIARGRVHVQSPIEEDADRSLRFVVEDGEGPSAILVHPGSESVEVHPIGPSMDARLHAGRGIAFGEHRVASSLDGGATWSPLALPDSIDEAALAASAEGGDLGVSELGARVGRLIRVGWGPPDAEVEPTTPSPPIERGRSITWKTQAGGTTTNILSCKSAGAVTGTAPLGSSNEARKLLEPAAPKPTSGRHESAVWSPSRAGMLDPVALLEEESSDARATSPSRWTLRWHDPREIGGRTRSAVIPVPTGASWGTSFRFGATSGARLLVALRSGTKTHLVRVRSSGVVDVAESSNEVVPIGDAAFGDGRSDGVAWAHDATVIVWQPGERPRAIARVASNAERWLGAPTATAVPILLGSADWAAVRMIAIAPSEKSEKSEAPPLPSLDGWTRLAPAALDLRAQPACSAKTVADARFSITRFGVKGATEIDGAAAPSASVLYDLRIHHGETCLAGAAISFSPGRRSIPSPPPAGAPLPQASFVRADLVAKRAEGGERGPPPASVRRMTCDLVTRPRTP